jgi:phenylalanyl-tRNA synthetase alpha subunit
VDAGYSICEGYLPPYRNQRHHLEDFNQIGVESVQEKFNFHHLSLRNVVERAFGLLKSRWHVLRGLPFYKRSMQVNIIIACFALHNYLLDRGHIGGSGVVRMAKLITMCQIGGM